MLVSKKLLVSFAAFFAANAGAASRVAPEFIGSWSGECVEFSPQSFQSWHLTVGSGAFSEERAVFSDSRCKNRLYKLSTSGLLNEVEPAKESGDHLISGQRTSIFLTPETNFKALSLSENKCDPEYIKFGDGSSPVDLSYHSKCLRELQIDRWFTWTVNQLRAGGTLAIVDQATGKSFALSKSRIEGVLPEPTYRVAEVDNLPAIITTRIQADKKIEVAVSQVNPVKLEQPELTKFFGTAYRPATFTEASSACAALPTKTQAWRLTSRDDINNVFGLKGLAHVLRVSPPGTELMTANFDRKLGTANYFWVTIEASGIDKDFKKVVDLATLNNFYQPIQSLMNYLCIKNLDTQLTDVAASEESKAQKGVKQ